MSDVLRCKTLEICDDDDKVVATLTAADKGAGLWINGPDGGKIAIYAIKGQMCVGMYDAKSLKEPNGLPLALTLGDGVPAVQFRCADGMVCHVKMEEVKEAVMAIRAVKESGK